MIRKIITITILIVLTTNLCFNAFSQDFDYNSKWQKVKSLSEKGQPKSATELVDEIYATAKSQNNSEQVIKSLLYKASLISSFEEDYIVKSIDMLSNNIADANKTETLILNSLIAELYHAYYNTNRWEINKRVPSDDINNDISTWDAVMFNKKITHYYMSSVDDYSLLSSVPLSGFKDILIHADSSDLTTFTTLFDLLANRAINYFSSSDYDLATLGDARNIDADKYMTGAGDFLNMKINPQNSAFEKVMWLYQSLIKLHSDKNNLAAIVNFDLLRLKTVFTRIPNNNLNGSNYITVLSGMAHKYKNQPVFVDIAFELANQYYISGQDYSEEFNPEVKLNYVIADSICQQAMSLYPNYQNTNKCRNLSERILSKDFGISMNLSQVPDMPTLANIEFKNTDELFFRIVKGDARKNSNRYNMKDHVRSDLNKTPVKSWSLKLPKANDHRIHTVDAKIPALPYGYYLIYVSDDPEFSTANNIQYSQLSVSDISYIINENPTGSFCDLYVLDRQSGKPVKNVDIKVYNQKYDNRSRTYSLNQIEQLISDEEGYAIVGAATGNNYGTFLFEFSSGKDTLYSENYLNFFRHKPSDNPVQTTYLFTDRAIYRPGQVVYFKGILIEKLQEQRTLIKNEKIELEIKNQSGKVIKTFDFQTNEFGSFDGSFVIPDEILLGKLTLRTSKGSLTVKVEEYKRPTYKIEFDSIEGQPVLDENVTIRGKAMAYSGFAVTNANVVYRVIRKVNFPWWPVYGYSNYRRMPIAVNDMEITNGETVTDDNGEFSINFEALSDADVPQKMNPVFRFEIIVDVTDITGETHTKSTTVSIGAKSLIIDLDIPDVVEVSNLHNLSLSLKNIAGDYSKANVNISLHKLTPPERLLSTRKLQETEFSSFSQSEFVSLFPHLPYKNEDDPATWPSAEISSTDLFVNGSASLPESLFQVISAGEYMVKVLATDEKGNEIKTEKKVTIYQSKGKQLPGTMINFVTVNKTLAEPGDEIVLTLGSAAKRSSIMYEVIVKDKVIERERISLKKRPTSIVIPVKESYRGNFTINVIMVRFNESYAQNFNIVVPYTNKKLDIAVETHRDFLTPGSKEIWKVKVSGIYGETFSASLLAGMYDASLDVFASQPWKMQLYYSRGRAKAWEAYQFRITNSSKLYHHDLKYYPTPHSNYPAINWFGYKFLGYYPVYYDNADLQYRKSVVAEVAGEAEEYIDVVDKDASVVQLAVGADEGDDQTNEIIPIRKNFAETAFIYPDLITDSTTGEVSFSFTTPDALTLWKLQLLSYTDDLKVGTYETTIESRKDLMVVPNVPRFVYQNDTLEFAAKVVNNSTTGMNITTDIMFFDGLTGESLDIFLSSNKPVVMDDVKAGISKFVSWKIAVPDDISMLKYRIKTSSDRLSDSEERMIPVLTNRMLITNSMPMNVGASSTKVFSFDALKENESKTLRNKKYTVEFTSSPSWYAVQAIPYLSEPKNKGSLELFRMYYANALSSFIINSNPKIKEVLQSWRDKSPDAFLSNLEKNEELKNIILEATPWVLEAENETEQKRRIAVLFDINHLQNQKNMVLDKLKDNQLSSGAWPWFKGMKDDVHTTQSIVLGIARLNNKGVIDIKSDNSRLRMLSKAVAYLDAQLVRSYNDLKEKYPDKMNSYHITSYQTQYLYARALLVDVLPVKNNTREAFDYYTNQAKTYWLKQSNYLQGMTAITLKKLGHRNESEAIVRSLKERSLYNKDMGMYWRTEKGWNWYQSPIETQAMMITMIAELDNNPTLIEQMKVWLLRQKQTQHWKTTSATAEAVFTLLMYGNNNLDDNNLVDITVGGETIDISGDPDISSEAGTGYFTKSFTGTEIDKEMANISVINPNKSIAWGAVYWQYFEDIDKVVSNDSPLSIKKTMFVERLSDTGPVLVKMDENDTLSIGDKVVVRLQVVSAQTMDYVHLKDMRATSFEPIEANSGYMYDGGLWYYKSITDVGIDFFIQNLAKGSYVIEYPLFVTQKGSFTNGIATIQSLYAPEFGANTGGVRVVVD